MAKVDRVVKYAGISQVSNERGEHSVNFHTSNQSKYAVWSALPEDVDGPGHSVTFTWFKLPPETTKPAAVALIMNKGNVPSKIKEFLSNLYNKMTTKPVKAARVKKVTVEVKDKPLSPGATLIKKMAQKRESNAA